MPAALAIDSASPSPPATAGDGPTSSGPRGGPWERAAVAVFVATCAVVPCVFTTRLDDVFTLPKIVMLWISFAVLFWLVVLNAMAPRSGTGFGLQRVAIVDVPVALFVAWNVVAFALSTDRHQSLLGEQMQYQGVLTLLLYVGFFYFARALVSTTQRVALVFGAIAVGATAASCYAIVQFLGLDPIWGDHLPSGRVFSTIGQPNALAAYLVVSIPVTVALGLGLGATPPRRLAALMAAALMVGALSLTVSRGGYLGLAATLPILAFTWLRDKKRRRVLLPLIGLILAVAVVIAILPATRTAVTSSWDQVLALREGSSSDSTRFHLDEWKVAVRIVHDNPLVGTGPETFPEQFPRYSRMVLAPATVSLFDQYRVESPHNVFLATATGAGIPAVATYLWLLVAAVYLIGRAAATELEPTLRLALVAVLAAMIGHLTTDSFTTAEITSSWLFWTLMGIGVGLASRQTRRRSATTPSETPQPPRNR